jgi:phosphoglycerate dehydrogenase-like enzyme
METAERALLVTLPADGPLRRTIGAALPNGVPILYAAESTEIGWTSVVALLVGNLRRELPGLGSTGLPGLEFVQQIYTGLDDFPFDRIRPSAKVAGNVGAYAPFVAEHAVALLLASARRIVDGHLQTVEGKLRPTPVLTYLGGETAIIVGYGEIGRELADRLHGLGMRVVGVDRRGEPRAGADRMVSISELAGELAGPRVVVNCLPLTRATRAAFDDRAFSAMREDAIYVSVGRAGTTDPMALERKLRGSPDFRAALDVWWNEEFEAGVIRHPFDLRELPNLLGSPHRAGVVAPARSAVIARALENMARFFRGETPRYVVDRREYEGSDRA